MSLYKILTIISKPGDLKFRILPKSSASPTLLILTNIEKPQNSDGCPKKVTPELIPVCIKTWNRPDELLPPEEQGCEYEKRIYSQKIHSIIQEDDRAPFLRYIGDDNECTTVGRLANYIGADDDKGRAILYLAFYVLNEISINPNLMPDVIDYHSVEFYRNFFEDTFSLEKMASVRHASVGAILTPRTTYRSFADILTVPVTTFHTDIYKEVVRGLYLLYKNRVVHNDIHSGNIMIENDTNKVLIYDWDRAYSPDLGDNPLLDENLCRFSQCNRFFHDGRPIDLIKSMAYIVYNSYDVTLESSGLSHYLAKLRIPNHRLGLEYDTTYRRIFIGIKDGTRPNCFFNIHNQSSLYTVGLVPNLEQAINLLGNWEIIFTRAFPEEPVAMELVPEEKVEDLFAEAAELVPMDITPLFGLTAIPKNDFSKLNLPENRSTMKQLTSKHENPIKRLIAKKQNKNFTWADYVSLQNIINELKYGPPIPIDTEIPDRPAELPPARNIGEIMITAEKLAPPVPRQTS